MSTRRHRGLGRLAKGPTGRTLCRWCGVEVTPPRRTFCSDACVHEHRIRSDASYVRALLFARDRGACGLCGRDTDAIEQGYRAWLKGGPGWSGRPYTERCAWLDFHGFPRHRPDGGWWDADHVVPVVEGGGECGIENYRTLCIPCHRAETAALARRRAEGRRGTPEPLPLFADGAA